MGNESIESICKVCGGPHSTGECQDESEEIKRTEVTEIPKTFFDVTIQFESADAAANFVEALKSASEIDTKEAVRVGMGMDPERERIYNVVQHGNRIKVLSVDETGYRSENKNEELFRVLRAINKNPKTFSMEFDPKI